MTVPGYEPSLGCVHCGLCLPACPTYELSGLETESPRGRIALFRAMAEGRVADPGSLTAHFDQCLGCRACESLCPSGVQYGEVLQGARAVLRPGSRLARLLLRHVVPHKRRLRVAFRLGRFAESLGLRALGTRLGWVPAAAEELVPWIPRGPERAPLVGTFEAEGERRGTVALFTGCITEQLFGDLNRRTRDLLVANGFRVVCPPAQRCCGALAAHAGELDIADELARHNELVFEDFDVVIHNASGCGAAMREHGPLAAKSRDICAFLAEVGLRATPARFPHRVAYDDPCHLCHGQGVRAAPRELLAEVPELELVPHADPESCCGSAGTFNLSQPEIAAQIGARKAAALLASGADVVATGNPGCILQVRAHLRRSGAAVRVVHPVELLLPTNR